MKYFFLLLYYLFLRHLPHSTIPILGPLSERLRYLVCKNIFYKCGMKVNVSKGASFGNGSNIEIGDYSGIGINAKIPNNVKIGKYVMMGQNVTIIAANHRFDRVDIPMMDQGHVRAEPLIIEDDVWIGSNVIILPGKHIRKGTIVAAGSVVTKVFPPYSIIGGNPAKLIKSRSTSSIN